LQYIGLEELLLTNITYSLLLAFGVVFTMMIFAALPALFRAPPPHAKVEVGCEGTSTSPAPSPEASPEVRIFDQFIYDISFIIVEYLYPAGPGRASSFIFQ